MMTTMCALMATLPIALGSAQAANRAARSASPSSAACFVSQCLTLYITPVVYLYLNHSANGARANAKKIRPVQSGINPGGGMNGLGRPAGCRPD